MTFPDAAFGPAAIHLSFAAPALLYGLAGLSVPILIHLLFKARKQTVVFSWIRFIRESVVRRSSRLRFQELVLLLLRLAALALIVLAFAQPFSRQPDAPASSGPMDVVFVVDDSLSMSATEGGRTRFEWARRAALDRLARLRPRDRAAVLKTTPPHDVQGFTEDLASARSALDALRPSSGSAGFGLALRRAASLLNESTAVRRGVVFLSDFQRSTWPGADAAVRDLPPGAFLEPVPAAEAALDNAAVLDVRPPEWGWRRGEPVRLHVQVARFGLSPAPEVEIEAVLDGRSAARRVLSLPPAEVRRVVLEFQAAGEEVSGYVRISGRDALPQDDRRHFHLVSAPPVRVLCVEQEIAEASFLQTTHFLRMALNPASPRRAAPGLFETTLIALPDLSANRLAGADVLVLADVAGFTDRQAEEIEAFVRQGGGLLVFGGERLEPAVYDARLYRKAAGPLPARIAGMLKRGEGEPAWSLRRPDLGHPVFQAFQDTEVDFYAPRFVRIQSVVETADSAVVPARFDDGSPAVAVREYGKGRCVLVLTSADVSWTDLPKRGEIFVPLAHQVMRYLHRGDPSRQPEWVLVGQPLALPQQIGPAASVALDGASAEGRRLTEEEVRGGRIAPPSSPGVYAIMDGDGRVRRRAVVNPAPAESDLASVMAEEWRSLARRGGTSGEALAEAEERLARPTLGDRVIWRSFLIGALALMLAELWLADRITR